MGAVPNVRAAAFRQSATEIGIERLAIVATSTTGATNLAPITAGIERLPGNLFVPRALSAG
jgi:hypothetical protein